MGSLHNRRRQRGERGAIAVEFALIVPLLLTMVGGIVDFGMAINRYAMVNNAAREGAREASLGATESEIIAVVNRGASGIGGTLTITVGCKEPDGTTCTSWDIGQESGGIAEVTVDMTSGWLTPIGSLAGSDLNIVRTSKMRIE